LNKLELDILQFKPVSLGDLETISGKLREFKFRTCDYNIVNLFSWGHFLNLKFGIFKERVLFYNFDWQFMLYPLGKPFSAKELLSISDAAEEKGYNGNFISVPEEYVSENPGIGANFEVEKDESNSDYVYLTEKLAGLSGKKLQKKKNLISQFNRNYPVSRTEVFDGKYASMCSSLAEKWCRDQNDICPDEKKLELEVLKRALANFGHLGLEGILLFSGDDLVAFAFFSALTDDTADVHFEKFDPAFKGSCQMINKLTAEYLLGTYKYLNREQDMGREGLRQAKLSYDPLEIVPTYKLIRKK
jgi:uncharacterized protein